MPLISYFDLNCIIPGAVRRSGSNSPSNAPGVWSLSFKLNQNVAPLFPYINGEMEGALWYEHPGHIRFLYEDYRCLLYPEQASAHFFETRADAQSFPGRFTDLLNSIDAKKENIRPCFDCIFKVPVMDILKILPKTNCRECGYPTCMAFAAAVAGGKAMADQCPALTSPMSETAAYPVLDRQGHLVNSVSLPINTRELKDRIQIQDQRVRSLEAKLSVAEAPAHRELAHPASQVQRFSLTNREIEVLECISQGYTNNEIGNLLFISPHTVKSHMINIFNKLNVNDRTQAAVVACRNGLI